MIPTMRGMFVNSGRRYGNRIAAQANHQVITYRDLLKNGCRLANALHAAGVKPGDRVAGMLLDRPESLVVHCASALGGFIFVSVNHRLVAPEVSYLLKNSGAKALVHSVELSHIVADVDCENVVVVTEGEGDRPSGSVSYRDFLGPASSRAPDVKIADSDIFSIGYTSGTTGFPKGAAFTHRAHVAGLSIQSQIYRMQMYGRLALSASISFVAVFNSFVLPTLYSGGSVRFCSGLDPDEWVDTMVEQGTTLTFLSSPLMRDFTEAVARRPDVLRTLDTIVHSASFVPRAAMEDLIDVAGDRFIEAYGMTESLVALTTTTRLDRIGMTDAEDPVATVGRAVRTSRVFAVDEAGNELPEGSHESGELVAESETLFKGYWNNDEATKKALRSGAYRTGDIGRVDAAGYVYLTGGRMSEMIISGGMNVYPAEVEQVLSKHPAVKEIAVFSLPHDRWGETVAAAVIRSEGVDLSEQELIEFSRKSLASYKKPTKVFFVDNFPRTASNKIKKLVLRDSILSPQSTKPDLED